MKNMSETGEYSILDFIEKNFSKSKDKRLFLGPGDDAALIKTDSSKILVATVDEMVEGTHFKKGFSNPEKIAKKLLRINLSDLAAMGNVKPLACLAAGGLPLNTPADWIKKFTRTLEREAEKFSLSLAGGNLAKSSNLHVSLTALGEVRKNEVITRYGAGPGDFLLNAGYLGDSKSGLEIYLKGKAENKIEQKLLERFWVPVPMFRVGTILGKYRLATAMLDNSDGLLKSCEIISKASKCGIRISLNEASVSKGLSEYCRKNKKDWREIAVSGGEDYGLIFSAKPENIKKIKKMIPEASVIGKIEKGKNVFIEKAKRKIKSFEHF